MCKAHILRFSCNHGVLMGIEACPLCPCPSVKTTSVRLPKQPFRCYNCQHKLSSVSPRSAASRDSSCVESIDSFDSERSLVSSSSSYEPLTSRPAVPRIVSHPLPGVVRQPTCAVQYCHNFTKKRSASDKPFKFSCSASNHYPTPHYATLPTFLPHQDHPCPPCQVECLRQKSYREATSLATKEFPHLTGEMLIRNGRRQDDCGWVKTITLERYVDEKRSEEKQMWLHVSRKWTQDLKRQKVLVAEEDGLGLLG